MPPVALVLASRSSERLRILRQAGIEPIVRPSAVDEDAEAAGRLVASDRALHLATCKARDIAGSVDDGLVLAADSVLVAGGRMLDKAKGSAEVSAWWRGYGGQVLTVSTGHCLVRARDGVSATELSTGRVQVTLPTEAEMHRYAEFDSVRRAAGAFVLEGLSAPFVGGVEGDPGAISGLSMPVVRRLALGLGYDMSDLWASSL